MLMNLLLGLPTMVLGLFLQSLLFAGAVRYYARRDYLISSPSFWASLAVIKGVMLLLVAGILAQVAIWALLFQVLGEFDRFSEAFYHSAVNFASLGYGDIVMSRDWKLLGPLEACCGVHMLGMTAAALTVILQQMIKAQLEAAGLK